MGRKIIRFDWALKKLLRQKANYEILEGFVSVLLNQDITINNITDSESNKEHESDKFNRVDIFAETVNKELIIIELQVDNEVDYFQRMAYGASKALVEHINEGDAYMKVRKIYSINIVYFDLGQGVDYVYHGITEFKGLHFNDTLQLSERQLTAMPQRKVSDIYPEYYVLKVNSFNDVAKDSIDEWMYVLKHSEVEDSFKAKGLDKLREKLLFESMTTEQKQNYRNYVNGLSTAKSTILTARLEGIAEGELRKALLMGLKCIRKNMKDDEIVDLTDLSIDYIGKLRVLCVEHADTAEQYLNSFFE